MLLPIQISALDKLMAVFSICNQSQYFYDQGNYTYSLILGEHCLETMLAILNNKNSNQFELVVTSNMLLPSIEQMGATYDYFNKYELAIKTYEKGIKLAQKLQDSTYQVNFIIKIGQIYANQYLYENAIKHLESALQEVVVLNDQDKQAEIFAKLGLIYFNTSQHNQATSYLLQALKINEDSGNFDAQIENLIDLGNLNADFHKLNHAVKYYYQALKLARKTSNPESEANILANISNVYLKQGRYESALSNLQASLSFFQSTNNKEGMGVTLATIGQVFFMQSQYQKALDYFHRSKSIQEETGYGKGVSSNLTNIALVHLELSDYEKSLNTLNEAIEIKHRINDKKAISMIKNNISVVFLKLGKHQEAIDVSHQSLGIAQKINYQTGIANALANIGSILLSSGNIGDSLSYFQKSLKFYEQSNNIWGITNVLNNISGWYIESKQFDKALDALERADEFNIKLKSEALSAMINANIGLVYFEKQQYIKSLDYYKKALIVAEPLSVKATLATVWDGIRRALENSGERETATFAGKNAVNLIQEIRTKNVNLEQTLQNSLLSEKEHIYRELASLLIEQGRIPEAEQVLAMLKEEEYFDYIRRDASADNRTTKASFTVEEEKWVKRYDEFRQNQITLAKEYDSLLELDGMSEEEEKRFNELERELDLAQEKLNSLLKALTDEFSAKSGEEAIAFGERQLEALESHRRKIAELGYGAVLIHTVVTKDKLQLILTTPETQLSRQSHIGERELNLLVNSFRQRLRRANEDPLPLAQKLYDHLLRPLEEDLKQANARTLMWSLDGTLRYVPIAALHDGQQYVVERFSLARYNAATRDTLETKRSNSQSWTVAGLGVSKEYPGFSPLPEVPKELEGIVRRIDGEDADGVLPGVIHLDEAFGRAQFKKVIRNKYPVLHVASHFSLKPGNSSHSYLLLGNGDKISMDEFYNGRAFEMPNVDLLTLSACNTAVGDLSSGGEVESFAVLAQRRGAKSVLATLWLVDDNGTGEFMQGYYRLRTEDPTLTKADTLRQAQLAMLRSTKNKNSGKDFSHPYYWAPFVLMGNWL